MLEVDKQNLINRNRKIIDIVLNEIKSKCPGSVDLVGLAGSFFSGDFHEHSDLDLVIIMSDPKARVLNRCFILGDIGFDIYTQEWSRFEKMAEYNNPFVTKLFDLDIIYHKDGTILDRYRELQSKVVTSMQDEEAIKKSVASYFKEVLNTYELINPVDKSSTYKQVAKIVVNIEYIIYMLNKTYVRRGVKRIPEEISTMNILPDNFLSTYLDISNFSNSEEAKSRVLLLINSVKGLLDKLGIDYSESVKEKENDNIDRRMISSDDLTGTYEEVYSNWRNKMYHAVEIGSSYLSFMTMAACQDFYDEMASEYEIPEIDLISFYNPDNLEGNLRVFDQAMLEWKKLYDSFGKEIVHFNNLEDLVNLYKKGV